MSYLEIYNRKVRFIYKRKLFNFKFIKKRHFF